MRHLLKRTKKKEITVCWSKFIFSTQLSGHLIFWLALLVLLQCSSFDWSAEAAGTANQLDRVQINGWTEVNKRWPLEENEFFVALEKGHHFIEVILPPQLDHDLDVRLEYYYDYEKVPPTFQMVPCNSNVDIIKNDDQDSQRARWIDPEHYTRDSAQPAGRWLVHEMRVRASDCKKRRKLEYNVLLKDPNDVFAWRVIEIKGISSDGTTVAPTTTQIYNWYSTESPQSPTTTEPIPTTPAPTTTDSPQNAPLVYTGSPTEPDNNLEDVGDQFSKRPGDEMPHEFERVTTTMGPQPVEEHNSGNLLERIKRSSLPFSFKEERDDVHGTVVSLICRPSSCERDIFHHPRFMPLVRGVPKLPRPNLLDQNYKFYLSTNDKELQLSQESSNDFADVDLCVDLELYMDPGTAIEFQVEDDSAESKTRLLELIERKLTATGDPSSSSSEAGKWEQFKRCTSEYMPKLRPADPNGHSIKLKFVPRRTTAGKQVALLADPKRSTALRTLYPTKDYLPNVATLPGTRSVDSYWILDREGARKPKLKFESRIPEESTSSGANPKRELRISNIEPKQESFDITSRWLKLSEVDAQNDPIFHYRADRADWVKEVDFQYQSVRGSSDAWLTRTMYVEYNPIEQDIHITFISDFSGSLTHQRQTKAIGTATITNPNKSRNRFPTGPAPTDTVAANTTAPPNEDQSTESSTGYPTITSTGAPTRIGQMVTPVKFTGLNGDEFRIRVRHHLTEEAQQANKSLDLNLITLAFADACAEAEYCKNGGSCAPTGTAAAKCTCLPGYHGEHCQEKRPCEVIYGSLTGTQLCESVGAKCDPKLPELRCTWPNDQFYRCEAIYQESGNKTSELVLAMTSSELEEQIRNQKNTILILCAFLVALLLFSIVIVGNMISRLFESKKRLRKAEQEAHELSRRPLPGGSAPSAPSFGRQPARQKPATVSYNNQAFDTE